MNTGSSKTKSILIKYKTDKPVRKTPYQVKGAIMRQFPNEEIVPMLNGQYRKKFLYPRIHVKVFNEEILLIGLNQGVDPFLKLQLIVPLIFFQFNKGEFSYRSTFSGNISIIALTNFPGCSKIPPFVCRAIL